MRCHDRAAYCQIRSQVRHQQGLRSTCLAFRLQPLRNRLIAVHDREYRSRCRKDRQHDHPGQSQAESPLAAPLFGDLPSEDLLRIDFEKCGAQPRETPVIASRMQTPGLVQVKPQGFITENAVQRRG